MVEKKEAEKKSNFEEQVNYVLSIGSIVFAFANPLLGVVLAIISLAICGKAKTELSIKTKKFSIIGLVLSVVIIILMFITLYFYEPSITGQLLNGY